MVHDVLVMDASHRVIKRHVPGFDAFIGAADDVSYHHQPVIDQRPNRAQSVASAGQSTSPASMRRETWSTCASDRHSPPDPSRSNCSRNCAVAPAVSSAVIRCPSVMSTSVSRQVRFRALRPRVHRVSVRANQVRNTQFSVVMVDDVLVIDPSHRVIERHIPLVQRFHRCHRRCVQPPSARHRSTSEPCSLVASAEQSTSRGIMRRAAWSTCASDRHVSASASRSNCSRNALESLSCRPYMFSSR